MNNLQKICQDCLKVLPQRTADVIERRFGLKTGERETLEAIGQSYEITRERVRQIENEGFSKIKPIIEKNKDVFNNFKNIIASFGGLKKEEELLSILGEAKYQNQAYFLLCNSKDFERIVEDEQFYAFWTIDKNSIADAKKLISLIIEGFNKERKTLSLDELLANKKEPKEVFVSYIEISKEIQKNPEGKYGLKNWLEINPRGIKDKAYLVLKKKEKPLHFRDIASSIAELPFRNIRKVHTATVHNELIKDPRFVLVGRGLYALKEW
ncbi:MAG: sigma factor-like helix-turn-helix DNA-binding protein, partial [Syntrophales bacterium]|nr:sigma factor-like helix-turn-helix DNA-binding protein [Syntrophales bacterium]